MIYEDYDLDKSGRNKSVINIEKRLNYLVEHDIRNEEIYKLLKQLAYIYINKNKYVYGYVGKEEVCHDVASDLWIDVINGKKVYAWLYYIGKMIKFSYIKNQKNIEHQEIQTNGDPILQENLKYMCAASSISCMSDFDDMQRNLFLEDVDTVVLQTMNNVKFKKGTKEWNSLYTNVCLNLIKDLDNKPRVYIRIDKELEPYVDIVIEQYKKRFRNSGFSENLVNLLDLDLSMTVYNDDNYKKEN